MASTGMIVIVGLISPYRNDRRRARKIVEASGTTFFEVFVDTPLDVCEERDHKGLYKRARAREIRNFTGIHAPYEKPLSPDITVFPAKETVATSVAAVMRLVSSPMEDPAEADSIPVGPESGRAMDANWRNWVKVNLERRCTAAGIKQILLDNGFPAREIAAAMGESYPQDAEEIDFEALANVRVTRPESGAVKFLGDDLQLYALEHFLTEEECGDLVKIINTNLRPSTVTVESNDKYFRTSSTCFLTECRTPLVEALDQKIATTLGINVSYSEPIQAQKYLPGQQFKLHTDFFQPGTKEYKEHCQQAGNRTWTFMIYLSDVENGGGTAFPKIGHTFLPRKGMAVTWNNLCRDGTPNRFSLHSGEPVEAGEKIIITKWFREKGVGNMFGCAQEQLAGSRPRS